MVTGDQELQWAYLLCPTFELSNSEGKPLTNGYIELYIAGTRDKYYAASDFAGTLHPFQIPLDSLGSNIVLVSPDNAYDIYVYNRFGNLVMSRYNVVPTNGAAGGGSSSSNISIESGDGTVVVTESTDPETGVKTFDLSVPSVSGNPSFWTGRGAATMGVTISDTEYHKLDISNHSIRNRNDDITVVDGEFNLKKGVYFWNVTVQLDKYDGHDNTRQRVFIESGYNRGAYTMDMTHDETETISFSGITVADYDDTKQDIKIKSEGESPFKASLYNVSIHKLNQNVLGDNGTTYTAGDYIEITEDDVINVTGLTTPEDVEAMIDAAITALASGDIYTGGDYINIDNHVISVTGLQPEGDYLTQEDLEGYATETYVDNSVSSFTTHTEVYNATVTAIEVATGAIPDTEEVNFEEINLEDYALASAIPDVSDFTTHTEVYESTVTAIEVATGAIPDTEDVDFEELDITQFAQASAIPVVTGFATHTEVYEAVVTGVQLATAQIPDQLEAGDYVSIVNNIINVTGLQPEGDYATQTDVHEATVTAIEHVTALIPEAQVQSDWTEADTADPSYIQNKPEEVRLVAGDNVTITETATSVVISAADPVEYTEGWGIDIDNNTISVVSSIIPTVQLNSNNQVTAINNHTLVGKEYTAGDNIYIEDNEIGLQDVVTIYARPETASGVLKLGNIAHWGNIDYGPGLYLRSTMDDDFDNRTFRWYITGDHGYENRFWGAYDDSRPDMGVSGESFLEIHEGDIHYRRGDFDSTDRVPVIWSCSGMRYDIDRLQEAVTAIPAAQVQSNWNETDTSSPAYIQNKPNLNLYATDTEVYEAVVTGIQVATGLIPAAQVQSNWTEADTTDPSYIQNKPTEKFLVGGDNVNITETATSVVISAQGGGSTYTAGQYISIDANNEISVTGLQVAGNYATQADVYDATVTALETATGFIPDSEDVDFEEFDITQFALASAVPTVQLNGDDQVTSINNHEIAGTGADPNIFWAIYGTTTYDEVKAAHTAGKKIVMYDGDGNVVGLTQHDGTGGATERFYFCWVQKVWQPGGPTLKYAYICKRDGWYRSYTDIQADWNVTNNYYPGYIKNKPSIPVVELNSSDQVTAIDGHTLAGGGGGGSTYTAGDYISIENDEISVTGVGNLVAGNNITITESGDNITISAQGGGSTYTAGQYISIDSNDVIAVTGLAPVSGSDGIAVNNNVVSLDTPVEIVAGDNITISVTGASAIISAQGGGGGGTTYTAGQYISIDANNEISVTGLQVAGSYATTSDISDMATKTWVGNQGYLTSIPSTYATDIEVSNAVVTGVQTATGWVNSKGYLTSIPSTYATDSEVATAKVEAVQAATGWVNSQGYAVPNVTRYTAYDLGAALYNGTGVTIGNTSAKIKLNLSNILTSYTVSNWTVSSTRLTSVPGVWEVKVSAVLKDVIGTQWAYKSNAVSVTAGHISDGPHCFPCWMEWTSSPTIEIVTTNDWTQQLDAILRDVRNSTTADNNYQHINFTIHWFNL